MNKLCQPIGPYLNKLERYIFYRAPPARFKSSSSSKRWLNRQSRDQYSRQAQIDEYRSRAAYKLEEMNNRFKIFKPGQTVVDLGYAPGSWSQVAAENTQPNGRVIGVDLIPVQPPTGVSAIQGNFLDPKVQSQLKKMLAYHSRGRVVGSELKSPLDKELSLGMESSEVSPKRRKSSGADVVLSDMCGIETQTTGFWVNSINIPYRLANTSGIVARDHAMSIDLCDAALVFCLTQLRIGGTFVCKFYTGSEDSELESRLKRAFKRVSRVKPSASRSESREAYFVAQQKLAVDLEAVFVE